MVKKIKNKPVPNGPACLFNSFSNSVPQFRGSLIGKETITLNLMNNNHGFDGIRNLATQRPNGIPRKCAVITDLELLISELVRLRLAGGQDLFIEGRIEYVTPMWQIAQTLPKDEGNLEVVFANPAPDLAGSLDYNIATFSKLHQDEIERDAFVVEHNAVKFICRRLTLSAGLQERSQIVSDLQKFATHTFVLGSTSNIVL